MATVIPAEGAILARILEAPYPIGHEGLSRQAYARFDAAQMKTAWGRRHQRRFALVEGADVLASATQYNVAGIFDQRSVRVCGIGSLLTDPAHSDSSHARAVVEQLLNGAERDGADMALLFVTPGPRSYVPDGFEAQPDASCCEEALDCGAPLPIAIADQQAIPAENSIDIVSQVVHRLDDERLVRVRR